MTGTIIINASTSSDVRTVDFLYIAEELRARCPDAIASKVFWPLDEGGMKMLSAEKLDPAEFKIFAEAICAIPESGMHSYLKSLIHSIESDRRFAWQFVS